MWCWVKPDSVQSADSSLNLPSNESRRSGSSNIAVIQTASDRRPLSGLVQIGLEGPIFGAQSRQPTGAQIRPPYMKASQAFAQTPIAIAV
jgi:hypothetical protein